MLISIFNFTQLHHHIVLLLTEFIIYDFLSQINSTLSNHATSSRTQFLNLLVYISTLHDPHSNFNSIVIIFHFFLIHPITT
jgi:hypothetical protein